MYLSLKTNELSLKTNELSLMTIHLSLKTNRRYLSLKTIHLSLKTIHLSLKTIHLSLKTIHLSLKTNTTTCAEGYSGEMRPHIFLPGHVVTRSCYHYNSQLSLNVFATCLSANITWFDSNILNYGIISHMQVYKKCGSLPTRWGGGGGGGAHRYRGGLHPITYRSDWASKSVVQRY